MARALTLLFWEAPLMASDFTLEFERPLIELEKRISELRNFVGESQFDVSEEIQALEARAERLRQEIFRNLTPSQRYQLARHPGRPFALDYISRVLTRFIELHGDRAFRDDPSIIGGIAFLNGTPVTVIGTQKGRDTKENIKRNFGMPYPEGYRKALRLMKQAEKFGRPIVTIIDTPAAYPGSGAEERGQAEAIAMNLREMSRLRVPLIAAVTGEGGSGGALALGLGNKVLMMENAIYSVCPPQSCAAIIWRDGGRWQEAADALKLTSDDLLQLGVVDEVVPEPGGAAHRDRDGAANSLRECLIRALSELSETRPDELVRQRYEKFRNIGRFLAEAEAAAEGQTRAPARAEDSAETQRPAETQGPGEAQGSEETKDSEERTEP
jgi:acetyl-CoA carboxylase carboxyl transferase subunit alpha